MLVASFQADLDNLCLNTHAEGRLCSAIEARATELAALGVSLAGLVEAVAGMVRSATGRSVRVLLMMDEPAARQGFDIVILAAVLAAAVV